MCNVLFCLFCTHFNCCLFHYLVLTSQWERLFLKRCVVLCRIKHEFVYHCAGVSFCSISTNSSEGSSPELRMSQTSPDWSVSQLIQPSSTPDDNSKEKAFVHVVATTAESESTTDKLEASAVQFCVQNCKHNRSEAGKTFGCGLCMEWFHFVCVDENPKHKSAWACPSRRKMPKILLKLSKDIDQLKNVIDNNKLVNEGVISKIDALTVENYQLKSTSVESSESIDKLVAEKLAIKQENESLKQKLAQLEGRIKPLLKLQIKLHFFGDSLIQNTKPC